MQISWEDDKYSRWRGISHLSISLTALKSILTSTIGKHCIGFHNQSTSFKDKKKKKSEQY